MLHPDQLLSLLSDQTRLRALLLMVKGGELCVCELTQVTGNSQPKISRHLALMRKSGLVSDERRGQWVYYRLSDDLEEWARQIVVHIADQLIGMEPFASDLASIEEFRRRGPCGT